MATTTGRRGAPLGALAILIVLACCAELSSGYCIPRATCLKVCRHSKFIRQQCESCNPGFKCDGGDSLARRQVFKARQSVDQTTLAPTRDTTTDFITANDITTVADPTDPDITTPTDAPAGCSHLGQDRPEGSVWPDSLERPCDFYTCRNGEVFQINSTQCDPAPNDNCEPWHSFGKCCPKWDCDQNPGDRPCDYQGTIYQDGATWPENALRPCIYFGCRDSVVYIAYTEPPCPPSPGSHCLARQVPYQCCPAYDCVNITCAYKNQTFLEGAIWPDNALHPCKWFICQRTGVTLFNSTSCEPVSAESCGGQTPIVLPGECCKQCPDGPGGDDSMCMDPSGAIHDEGCIYFNDIAQCVLVECVNNTEVVVLDLSENCPPPPHPSCTAETNPLECCPTYTCPPAPCTDYLGNPRAEGEIYYKDDNECILVQCVNGTEVELVDLTESCQQPPPDANCTVTPEDGECCPRIICPNFCIYNGKFYPVGVQWWDDDEKRCTRYECKPFGVIAVVSTELPCRRLPRGCVGQTAPPQCCPFKYTCMYDLEGNLIPMN